MREQQHVNFWTPWDWIANNTLDCNVCRCGGPILNVSNLVDITVSLNIGLLFFMWIPWKMVFWRFRRRCLVVVQCITVGLCMHWESLLMAKEMSRRINERYWRMPIMQCYSVLSTTVVPYAKWSEVLVDWVLETSFEPSIIVLCSRS